MEDLTCSFLPLPNPTFQININLKKKKKSLVIPKFLLPTDMPSVLTGSLSFCGVSCQQYTKLVIHKEMEVT